MHVYEIDPATDERWDGFIQSHPRASVFHSAAWLEALRRTYGYRSFAVTTSPPGSALTNGIPFCEVKNFFWKPRLVSLPFSDHCQPLVQDPEELTHLLRYLRQKQEEEGWQYVEIRPVDTGAIAGTGFKQSQSFWFHKLDLCCSPGDLFHQFHHDCVQRKIRRADRERLRYEEGTSESLLERFYRLLLMTRRRHGIPTQPIKWFRNLIACLGTKVNIALASKDDQPIASILTLRHKCTVVYKYGCSDRKFNALGGMQFLFWQTIQKALEDQLWEFDLGRSDRDNPGLVVFKDRWGAAQSELTYLRCGRNSSRPLAKVGQTSISKYLWAHAPDSMLSAASRALYRHLG
jgi:hypothetical protein